MSKHGQSESFRTELHDGAIGNMQAHSVALVPHDLSKHQQLGADFESGPRSCIQVDSETHVPIFDGELNDAAV